MTVKIRFCVHNKETSGTRSTLTQFDPFYDLLTAFTNCIFQAKNSKTTGCVNKGLLFSINRDSLKTTLQQDMTTIVIDCCVLFR